MEPEDGAPAAPAQAETKVEARRASSGRTPLHWLLEGLFIVVSVVLGFGISEYGQSRDEDALAARMLASISAEVRHNRAMLDPFVPMHREWRDQLQRQDPAAGTGSGLDVLFATRPALPREIKQNVPLLRSAAWDTALSTGALRLIDYDLAAGLSEIYSLQEYAASTFAKLFGEVAFYDPAGRSAAVRMMQTALTEMVWVEETLMTLYDQHLPGIQSGAGGR